MKPTAQDITPLYQTILDAICNEYQITIEALLGRSRLKGLVAARQMASYMLRVICRLESTEIAKITGRFYTTVDFSIHQVEDMLRFDKSVQLHYNNLLRVLKHNPLK